MTALDEYVRQVLQHVPPASPERQRIEIDLRAHLEETLAAEGSAPATFERMGAPVEVARAYLADVPLHYTAVWKRLVAVLFDLLVGVVLIGGIFLLIGLNLFGMAAVGGQDASLAWAAMIIIPMLAAAFVLSIVYFPVLEARFGQTAGKWLLGMHVVKEDGTSIGAWDAIVRRIPFFLEFFWIDGIVALFTERRQRAFDLVARTVVVDVQREPAPAESLASTPVGSS